MLMCFTVTLALPRDINRNLDATLKDLSHSFAEGSEYFSVLVKIFQGVFQGDKQVIHRVCCELRVDMRVTLGHCSS